MFSRVKGDIFMSDSAIMLYISLFIMLMVLCLGIIIYKRAQLKRYTKITIGMPEKTMLQIMGGGYNKSSLKNNRNKYEWRINSSSYGKGGFRGYSGVSKVDIYTKNGVVEEIKPYNV